MKQSEMNKHILNELKSLGNKIDILVTEQAVISTKVEERTGKKAIIVSSIGGIITFAATLGAAVMLK